MYKGYRDVVNFGNFGIKEEPLTKAEEAVHYELITKKNPEKIEREKELIKKFIEKNLISEKEVGKDDAYLARAKENFEDATQRSELLEAVLSEVIRKISWFGKNRFVIDTAEYDDVANHTDFVVEIKTESGEVLRVAIDVTVSDKLEDYEKKAGFVVRELQRGHGTMIKYLESQAEKEVKKDPERKNVIKFSNKLMSAKGVPRAIIAYSKDNLDYLCKTMADMLRSGQETEAFMKLEESGLQMSIIEEMISQFKWQLDYLKQSDKTETAIGRNLAKIINYLEELEKIKKGSIRKKSVDGTLKVAKIDYGRV